MPANRQNVNGGSFFDYSELIKSRSQRTAAAGVRGGDADAQDGGFYGTTTNGTAPPTAADAPTKGNDNIFVGLCDALNQHQKQLEKQFPGYVADQYVINFAPPTIGASQVVKSDLVYKNTAGKKINTAQAKLDPSKDAVNTKSQNWQVLAGTQVVQFIDQVMRSSTYITSQQKVNFDEDGKQTKNASAGTSGVTAWYKINLSARQLSYCNRRRDHAYRMTFTVAPYKINQMESPYFPNSTYQGAHKAYNYWFTGLNTQILSYEQEYNQAYYVTLSGNPEALAGTPPVGRDQRKQTYMATSEQRGQGQANYVNEPADSAASFLYSISDFTEVKLKIVGDPAWMQQGEVAFGINAQTFDFKPFNSDGGINFDSQEVVFTVSFNRPTDYNFNTGLMNTNSATGAPQETFTYIASSCKNVFSKGQFTQELVGKLMTPENNKNASATGNGRSATQSTATNTRTSPSTAEQIVAEQNASFEYGTAEGSEQTRMLAEQDAGLFDEAPQSTQPAPPPAEPSSSGGIDYTATEASPNASAAPTNDASIDDQASKAIKNQALADAAAASGDQTAAAYYNNIARNNRNNAAANARTAAEYGAVTTKPQQIARDE